MINKNQFESDLEAAGFSRQADDIIGKMKEYVTEYAASSERFLIEIQTVMNEYKAVVCAMFSTMEIAGANKDEKHVEFEACTVLCTQYCAGFKFNMLLVFICTGNFHGRKHRADDGFVFVHDGLNFNQEPFG